MTCDRCQQPLNVGDFPFCPHGPTNVLTVGDDIPGGFVQENFSHDPETFYSKKAMLRRADELGLRPRDQWAGPGDRYLSNWAAVSPKTLEDAKAMLERVGKSTVESEPVCETATFTVRRL